MKLTETIRAQLGESVQLRQAVLENGEALTSIAALAETIVESLRWGGKVIFAGNGGSFADAQHLAAEFVGRFLVEREPLSAACLGTNSSLATAVGNDYGFEVVFVRELKAIGRSGDVFLAISTSGDSANLIEAVSIAESLGIRAFGLLGRDGGQLGRVVPSIVIPSYSTPRIQEMHITIGHILCDLVDRLLLGSD